jgi:hypothetical protein
MRYLIFAFLLLSAHFALTPFAPGPVGASKIYWPFALDSRPWLRFVGGLPAQSGLLTALLAGLSGLGFLVSALGLFWNITPPTWWPYIVIISAIASILLYVLYFGPWALIPLVLDLLFLFGVFFRNWTVAGFRRN